MARNLNWTVMNIIRFILEIGTFFVYGAMESSLICKMFLDVIYDCMLYDIVVIMYNPRSTVNIKWEC